MLPFSNTSESSAPITEEPPWNRFLLSPGLPQGVTQGQMHVRPEQTVLPENTCVLFFQDSHPLHIIMSVVMQRTPRMCIQNITSLSVELSEGHLGERVRPKRSRHWGRVCVPGVAGLVPWGCDRPQAFLGCRWSFIHVFWRDSPGTLYVHVLGHLLLKLTFPTPPLK